MLLTAAEVAAHLRVSPKTIWRLVDSGELHVVRLTQSRRGWRFTSTALEALVVANEGIQCRSGNGAIDIPCPRSKQLTGLRGAGQHRIYADGHSGFATPRYQARE